MIQLTDEYEAAVRLGVISRRNAELEQSRSIDTEISRGNRFQRKAFVAGYLWLNFTCKLPVLDADMEQSNNAWNEWCDHLRVD